MHGELSLGSEPLGRSADVVVESSPGIAARLSSGLNRVVSLIAARSTSGAVERQVRPCFIRCIRAVR